MSRLGICSGIGSAAGVHLARQLVEEAQRRGAKEDSQFPEFILYNVPFTDTNEFGITDFKAVKIQLIKAVQSLDEWGCDMGIIACNTAHHMLPEVREASRLTMLNMIEIACDAVKSYPVVGIMSSQTTKQLRLYQNVLERLGIESVVTDEADQKDLDEIIGQVISGKLEKHQWLRLNRITFNLLSRGAKACICGCTELGCVLHAETGTVVIDAGRETVKRALELMA